MVEETKRELDKHDLPPIESVEVLDPFTGEKSIISLDRTGTHEKKLVVALADPSLTRDQKDHVLSMYLFERGKESASFLMDLMRYKGDHTKESRLFQSRVRYDFQQFVDNFTRYLQNQSRLLGITLGIDVAAEKKKFEEWLKLPNNIGKGLTYKDFPDQDYPSLERKALIEMAIYALDEVESLRKGVENIVKAREAQKGGGIYIAKQRPGESNAERIFSVNDPELDEIIKADRELIKQAEIG